MVMQTLLELDCIPSGMEFFPASDEDTFEFIKTVIDVCDYYVLIVSGKYGSVAPDGKSYTEKEYDYAVETGKPVLGFVRRDISKVTVSQTDQSPELAKKLDGFRAKVASGRIVKMWDNSDQLAGLVATTLTSAIKRYPAIGWIRGDQQPSSSLLIEINQLRKQNQELLSSISKSNLKPMIDNLAELDDYHEITYKERQAIRGQNINRQIRLTWGDILSIVGDNFRTPSNTSGLSPISAYIERKRGIYDATIAHADYVRILTQFELMGIMTADTYNLANGGTAVFHKLTPTGISEYLKRMAILKKETPKENS